MKDGRAPIGHRKGRGREDYDKECPRYGRIEGRYKKAAGYCACLLPPLRHAMGETSRRKRSHKEGRRVDIESVGGERIISWYGRIDGRKGSNQDFA